MYFFFFVFCEFESIYWMKKEHSSKLVQGLLKALVKKKLTQDKTDN